MRPRFAVLARFAVFACFTVALACSEPAASNATCADGESSEGCTQPRTDQGSPQEWAPDDGRGVGCSAVATEIGPHDETGLGFDAQTIIDLVAGQHHPTLEWRPSTLVDTSVNHTRSEIEVGIEVVGGAQRLHHTELLLPTSVPRGARALPCGEAIGLPVRVQLRSDDGALDEVVETTLVAAYGDLAGLTFALPASTLRGNLELGPDASAVSEPTVFFELGVTPVGVTGSITVDYEFVPPDGSAPSAWMSDRVARFPADHDCSDHAVLGRSLLYLEPDQELRGVSLNGTLARLNELGPLTARPRDSGASTIVSLTFAPLDDHLCLRLEPAMETSTLAEMRATMQLSSEDGALDGEFVATLRLEGSLTPESVSALAWSGSEQIEQAADVARAFGVQAPIDFSGFDGTDMLFRVSLEGSQVKGGIEVRGWRNVECWDAAGGVYPCRGAESSVLWGLDWSNEP